MPVTVNYSTQGGITQPDQPLDATITSKLKDVTDAIESGLKPSIDRLTAARANTDFYNGDNWLYIEKREAETDTDYLRRPKRTVMLTRHAVNTLSRKIYHPGPSRTFRTDENVATWLESVYRSAKVNNAFDAANKRAILNDCSAIQIVCTGNPNKPIRLYTHDAFEFEVWCEKDNPTEPWAVCLISVEKSSQNQHYRVYELWTADRVMTFQTQPIDLNSASLGIIARQVGPTIPNPYRVLPFVFFHNETPVDKFWGSGIGDSLRRANQELDRQLSDLAQQIQVFSCPDMFVRGVPNDFRYQKSPGRPQHLKSTSEAKEGDSTIHPEVFYLQPNLNIQEIWWDIEKYANRVFEDLDVPISATRESGSPTSGIQVIAEQIGFLDYLKGRALTVSPIETELAQIILIAAANYHEAPDLALAAESLTVDLVWPEPSVPVPSQEADRTDQWELAYGLASPIQVLMRRRGLTRDQAEAFAAQIERDNELWTTLFPNQTPGLPVTPPPPVNPYLPAPPTKPDASDKPPDNITPNDGASGEPS